MAKKLSHIDAEGRARMVDVGAKPLMRRTAVAAGEFVAALGSESGPRRAALDP